MCRSAPARCLLERWPCSSAACAALAGLPPAIAGGPGQGSSGRRHARERCGWGDNRSADIALTVPSSAPPMARPSLPCDPGSSMLIAPP
jgi:hypothetical protein